MKSHSSIALGDCHNFGKSVRKAGQGLLHKPRPVYLERLFLGTIDFRSKVNEVFDRQGLPSPFAWLPELVFGGADLYEEGYVEEIELNEPDGDLPDSDFEGIGCVIALLVWFGLGALHCQNILSGRSTVNGQFIFTPIDIECALERIGLPSDALLLPGKIRDDFCGLWPLFTVAAQAGSFAHSSAAAIAHGFYYTMRIPLASRLPGFIHASKPAVSMKNGWR